MMNAFKKNGLTIIFLGLFLPVAYGQDSQTSVLLQAAEKNEPERIKMLIEGGIDVNSKDMVRNTAMHIAAFHGNDLVLKQLVELGGDVNAINQAGRSPAYEAVRVGHRDAVTVLLGYGADTRKAFTSRNETLLHVAVDAQRYEIVRLLLDRGADPRAKNADGDSALDLAKKRKDKTMRNILRGKG